MQNDNKSNVEGGFEAGANEPEAVMVMCDLMKLTTQPWKEVLDWAGAEGLFVEYKATLDAFQKIDESADNFEEQREKVGMELVRLI